MNLLYLTIILATFLCTLVAGFLLAFTIVVMPGIKTLSDHDFLQAFKAIDRVIQNNQPVFMLLWLGSVVMLLVAAGLSIAQLDGVAIMLVLIATVIYLLGVQLPTATINVPLNNQLQKQDLNGMTSPALSEARRAFEPRWIRWNSIRTVFATVTSVLLLLLVFNF